jgi:hypothetical protein
MPNHAIVDTGRNGVTGLRKEWGDWCNVNGAGSLSFSFLFCLRVVVLFQAVFGCGEMDTG